MHKQLLKRPLGKDRKRQNNLWDVSRSMLSKSGKLLSSECIVEQFERKLSHMPEKTLMNVQTKQTALCSYQGKNMKFRSFY